MIVAHGIGNTGSDQDQMVPMLDAIEQATGRLPDELSADAGYCSEDNLKALEERNVRGYVATGRQKHGTKSATGTGKVRAGSHRAAMRRGGHNSRYRLRKITIEPVFGQIKQSRGFRQFLLRGRRKVSLEWALICMAHNLNRLHGSRNGHPA